MALILSHTQMFYHGSSKLINGALKPVLNTSSEDHIHNKAAVFGTARADIASLFMFPFNVCLASVGFENDIAYICVYGTRDEFEDKDTGGYLYCLPEKTFEKVGKDYEWQSFSEVSPVEVKKYFSSITGIIENSGQVYFINDDEIFDKIVANKTNRATILKSLVSENQKQNINFRPF